MEKDTKSIDVVDAKYSAQHQVMALLDGFESKREQEEVGHFLKQMIDDWDVQLQKQTVEKKNADIENDVDIIQKILDKIQEQGKKKKSPEPKIIETVSVLEFVTEYCASRLTPFSSFYYGSEDDIGDNCKSVVTERELMSLNRKAEKKFNNAAKAYAYNPEHEPNEHFTSMYDVYALFDTTVFGSGKTGFCFTSSFVVFKDIASYPHELYYYRDIDDIGVNDEEFFIKGSSTSGSSRDYMKYNDHKATRALKIVCECVKGYTSQPAFQVIRHLKNKTPIN